MDKRKTPRVVPPSTLLACINNDKKQFVRIEDLSKAGIGFSYNIESVEFKGETNTIGLYDCTKGALFASLPVEVMNSRVRTQHLAGKRLTIIRQGARFRNLSQSQERLLTQLVDQCAAA